MISAVASVMHIIYMLKMHITGNCIVEAVQVVCLFLIIVFIPLLVILHKKYNQN